MATFFVGISFLIQASVKADNNYNVDEHSITKNIPLPTKKPDLNIKNSIEVAMALPKEKYNQSLGLSKNLQVQAKLAQTIFEFQSQEKIELADKLLPKLKDKNLRGHVLAHRYLETNKYISTLEELKNWLKVYSDYPQAEKIYKLAKKKGAQGLSKPDYKKSISGNLAFKDYQGKIYQTKKSRNKADTQKYFALKQKIRTHVQVYEPSQALKLLELKSSRKILDKVEYDRLLANIASGFLYAQKYDQALKLSVKATNRSKSAVPRAYWIKGLAYWQKGQYLSAAKSFEDASESEYASGWMVSSSAYWASRAYLRAGHKFKVRSLVEKAAQYRYSFYGVIANYALDRKSAYNFKPKTLTDRHVQLIQKQPHGKRAILLVQSGQLHLVEQELLKIRIRNNTNLKDALFAFANTFGLAHFQIKLANSRYCDKNTLCDYALFPQSAWSPKTGYEIDKALLNAVIRQESKFKSLAQNASGAAGLMQVMPRTAEYVSLKNRNLSYDLSKLKDPETNLALGQAYIRYLFNHPSVGQDLISMLIAYNAGPGTLSKWKRERSDISDPLFFIETIPFHETRGFIDNVLTNLWMYRIRYDQDIPSLEDLASGRWARYRALDDQSIDLAFLQ
ncbi:MAG: lytic transglycosylase domain-containing protein [Pseudomonadota bacterium]